MRRKQRRFPDLALVALAVANDAIGIVVAAQDAGSQRGSNRRADPLAERAGGQIDAGVCSLEQWLGSIVPFWLSVSSSSFGKYPFIASVA